MSDTGTDDPNPGIVVIGDLMVDVVARIPHAPLRGTDTPARITARGGGSGANLAAWLAHRGHPVHLIGRVGADALADDLRGDLAREGVVLHVGTDPHEATGTCIVLVDPTGERSMLPDHGANATLVPDDLPESVFVRGGHLHVSGYSLLREGSRLAALAAIDLARRKGMTTSVDVSSEGPIADLGVERFADLTRGIDICLANESEAAFLTAHPDPSEAASLLVRDYSIAVVKRGAAGALAVSCTGERYEVPAVATEVVDTTGAGDAFAAGLLGSWCSGGSLHEAMVQATVLAARAVARVGGRP